MYANIQTKRGENCKMIRGHLVTSTDPTDNQIIIYDTDNDEFVFVSLVNHPTFADHSARHQDGGADEISVQGLSGLLSDQQTPRSHVSRHRNGGDDELDVTGLSGVLADKQDADKIQGRNVYSAAPTNGQFIRWDSANSRWAPADVGVLPGGNLPTGQHGDLLFCNMAGEWVILRPVEAGEHMLVSNGPNQDPTYGDIDGGSASG
jgi:hypothetical protein